MKKQFLFLILMTLSLCAFAQKGYMHYKGYVGDQPITLKLKIVDTYRSAAVGRVVDVYEGSYTYTKRGNTLKLEGHESDVGEYEFTETTPKERESAYWFLYSDDEMHTFHGTMTLTKNDQEFPVKLTKIK